MDIKRICAQYKRHPEKSLDNLVQRLAKKKWTPDDIVREDKIHRARFAQTGSGVECVDRYIIANIAEQYSRKAKIKQNILKRIWHSRHPNTPFSEVLPARMAQFRQTEDIPFDDSGVKPLVSSAEWSNYLKSACFRH